MAPLPPPFDALGPEDWAAVWRAACRVTRTFDADRGSHSSQGATETVMLGGAHAEVGADVRGAWVELHRRRLREAHWPPMANPRARNNQRHRNNPSPERGRHTRSTHRTRNTAMATARRKSRKPARRVKRANPKARSSRRNPSARSCTSSGRRLRSTRAARAGRGLARCRWDATRTNPTTYARKLPSPFDRFTESDWARARSTALRMKMGSDGGGRAEVMFSTGPAVVGVGGQGAYAEALGHRLPHPQWPRTKHGGYATKRAKPSNLPPLKVRRRAARSNPGFAAGTPVWARINGRLYKATVLSTSGARARVAVIDPYSGREGIRETAVSHLQARPASRSNPRGDDREVTIYEVIYDGHGAGAAGDGAHIARFKSASDAARFAANHTAWGRPTKADAAKVPVRLARRWGVM